MIVGVAVTMSVSYRNAVQEFSNVFYYKDPLAITASSEAILDAVKAALVAGVSTDVTFVRGKVWKAGGTKAENQMLFQKNLTGTGSTTVSASMDRERAILVRFRAGFDTRGIPVYLRKWIHSCGDCFGAGVNSNPLLQQTAAFSSTARGLIEAGANNFKSVLAGQWQLCGPKGRDITGATEAHKYLEHHQLGEMWR